MPILPEGFSKNLDLLKPEHRAFIEQDVQETNKRLVESFKEAVREHHPLILPFGVLFGEHAGQAVLIAIPFPKQFQSWMIAQMLREMIAEKSGIVALSLSYDGYTTVIKKGDSTAREDLKQNPSRKDSIISVWKTVWGTGGISAVRYSLTDNGADFEEPQDFTGTPGFSIFDGIFPIPKSQVN
jgi:hypothetical protein